MKKILIVLGTRPEAIKMAPVILELQQYPEQFDVTLCCTGQHEELLKPILSFFDLKPTYFFSKLNEANNLSALTSHLLTRIENVVSDHDIDLMLVHGDTTSAFVASMVAFYHHIPVAHIEAGLRTGNIKTPWPEEMNRKLISQLTKFHFCPTERAKQSLLEEGINPKHIFVTGNTAVDAVQRTLGLLSESSQLVDNCLQNIQKAGVATVGGNQKHGRERPFILVTGHRRENFINSDLLFCKALLKLANDHPSIDFVYPVHLNPNVYETVHNYFKDSPNIKLIHPLNYPEFLILMAQCLFVITDSGGIQEEAPSLNKKVFVYRSTTERKEGLKSETSVLIDDFSTELVTEFIESFDLDAESYSTLGFKTMGPGNFYKNPFGDGTASQQIVQAFLNN